MAKKRTCRLVNTENREVNLRKFEAEIIRIIENTVPGKHSEVYENCFITDILSQGEAIRIGRALSKVSDLAAYGKTVSTFRLFEVCKTAEGIDDSKSAGDERRL